jgi:transposase InsO family protein
MRFRFIEDHRADYPVRIMCGALEVSPAGYYAWRSRPESRRSAANRDLLDHITRVHHDTRGRYGSPRIHVELRAQGRGRIERLMRRHGIRAIMARPRRVRTTDSRHDLPESAQSELQRGGAEPDLAYRYHLCGNRSGMALSGRRHGPVQPQDRRLGDGRSFAYRTAFGGPEHGHLNPAAWRQPDPPFRPRRSICIVRLPHRSSPLACRPR